MPMSNRSARTESPVRRTRRHEPLELFVYPQEVDRPNELYGLFAWDDVQYFLELVRKKTLVKASKRFGVSHTTVLRRIGNLEGKLDQKLFKLTSRGFVLTDAGTDFLVYADAMERAASQMIQAGTGKDKFSGPVRVVAIEGLTACVLVPAVKVFQDRHPDISVEVVTAISTANLFKREADISIGMVRPTWPSYVARRVARCDVYLYANDEYIKRCGEPASLTETDNHIFVDNIAEMIDVPAQGWLQDTVGEKQVVFRSTSPLVQLEAVKRGFGIGMFPTYLADTEPTLRRVLESEVRTSREFWVAIREELWNVPRISAFFDFVSEIFASNPSFYR